MSDKPFDLICLDTNQLRANGWPFLSGEVEWLVQLAAGLKIRICFPEPVLFEIRNLWLQHTLDEVSNAKKHLQKLQDLGVEGAAAVLARIPNRDFLRNFYEESLEKIFREYEFERIPYTVQKLTTMFEKAGKKELPFEAEGKGFQDAVIYWSFLDYARDKNKTGAFVSADAIFEKNRLKLMEIANQSGAKMVLYRDIAEISNDLANCLPDKRVKVWTQQRNEIEKLLSKRRDYISGFVLDALNDPESGLIGDFHFERIERPEIIEISQPWILPLPDRCPGVPVPLKFDLSISFNVIVDSPTMGRLGPFGPRKPFSLSISKEGVTLYSSVEALGEIKIHENHVTDFGLKSVSLKRAF